MHAVLNLGLIRFVIVSSDRCKVKEINLKMISMSGKWLLMSNRFCREGLGEMFYTVGILSP